MLLSAPASAAAAGPAAPDLDDRPDPALQRGLEKVVRDLGLTAEVEAGRLSLALVDLSRTDSPRLAMLNGNAMVYAASLPKIAILLGAFVEAARGRLTLDATHLAEITKMIRYSNNEAATRVLDWVGRERLLDILESPTIALYDPKRNGGLWVGKSYGPETAYRPDRLHQLSHGATAFQVARFYWLLDNDRLVSPELSALMKQVLSQPGIHHKFVKGLESRPGVEIYRKSGTWQDFHADSALVEHGPYKFVIVGLAHHRDGGEWLVRLAAPLHDLVVPAAVDAAP
ncbi:MAG TPA: serine hydrolase [Burkholderiaceae bacterium]|nr:serine hydrolase [Burkholderiaceae bacterium]